MDNLELALQKAFINKEALGDDLTPKFIVIWLCVESLEKS